MPRITVMNKVERNIHISNCPCCGGSNVRANCAYDSPFGGNGFGWVECNVCGHKVEVRGDYGVSYQTAMVSAINRWNGQFVDYNKRKSSSRDEIAALEAEIGDLKKKFEEMAKEIGYLRGWR